VLFCSRSGVSRTVRAYRAGALGWEHDRRRQLVPLVRTTVLIPTLRRSLLALLKVTPRAYSWCRTDWSCATLARTLQAKRGTTVPADTMRRWLHESGWGSAPNSWPKTTIPSGCPVWPASGGCSSRSSAVRP
jgi:transposase